MSELSTSTTIALAVVSGLAVILICIAVVMCCCGGGKSKCAGVSITIFIILLLACLLPILIIYGSEAETVKRNNLLIATLVPLMMTMIGILGYSVTLWLLDWELDGKFGWLAILLTGYVVLAVSVPVGQEFGIRFTSTPQSCATTDRCNQNMGIQVPTIIAIAVLIEKGHRIGLVKFWILV